ncbi:MAG: hypothetical protein U0984_03915 [Prosthecobacter sp.]|nr:hypothetical protein [Prosthecobacter sp.]
MPLLDRFESRFGRFALPGLLQSIAVLQLLTFVLFLFLPPEAKGSYQGFLRLDGDALMRGEVWRFFTYIFIPVSMNPFFAAMGAMFLMWIGRGLDEAWGPFRVNLYVLGGLIPQAIAGLLGGNEVNGMWLYYSTLFAMACIYPNEEILLFFILPVKLKWIAWLGVASLVLMVLNEPSAIVVVLLAQLNFLIAFGPGFLKGRVQIAKVTQRRQKYEQDQATNGPFFRCTICGKSDVDDPTLDFRVTEEGNEICSECRKARVAS